MATIVQDWNKFLAKGKVSLQFPNASELNLLASDMGEGGLSVDYDGETVERLAVMFGFVGVANIARGATITVEVNKTIPIANIWRARGIQNSIVIGGVNLVNDVGDVFFFTQVSISLSGHQANGTQASYSFTVGCVEPVNTELIF